MERFGSKKWKVLTGDEFVSAKIYSRLEGLPDAQHDPSRMWHIIRTGVMHAFTENLCEAYPDIWFTGAGPKAIYSLFYGKSYWDVVTEKEKLLLGLKDLVEGNCQDGVVQTINIHAATGVRGTGVVIYEGMVFPFKQEYVLVHKNETQHAKWLEQEKKAEKDSFKEYYTERKNTVTSLCSTGSVNKGFCAGITVSTLLTALNYLVGPVDSAPQSGTLDPWCELRCVTDGGDKYQCQKRCTR